MKIFKKESAENYIQYIEMNFELDSYHPKSAGYLVLNNLIVKAEEGTSLQALKLIALKHCRIFPDDAIDLQMDSHISLDEVIYD